MTRLAPAVVLVLVALSGCEQNLEFRYETEHLRIATSFDAPLCRGDLDRMEAQIEQAEVLLDTSLDHRVDVYLWWAGSSGDWYSVASDACGAMTNGSCYDAEHRVLFAAMDPIGVDTVSHGLMHPVIDSVSTDAPAFIVEGAAWALAAGYLRFPLTSPVDSLELDWPLLDTRGAGFFSRWLLARDGQERYAALLRAEGSAREALEATYGVSVETLEAEYFADALYGYAPLVPCDEPALQQIDSQTWLEQIDVDCDAAHSFGGPKGMRSHRIVEIETRNHYAFTTSAETLLISRCEEDLPEVTSFDDPERGEVTISGLSDQLYPTWRDTLAVRDLGPGRYRVTLSYPTFEARSDEVSMWVYYGPVPVQPGAVP